MAHRPESPPNRTPGATRTGRLLFVTALAAGALALTGCHRSVSFKVHHGYHGHGHHGHHHGGYHHGGYHHGGHDDDCND